MERDTNKRNIRNAMFKNLKFSRHYGLALATMLAALAVVAIFGPSKVADLNERIASFSLAPIIFAFLAGSATTLLAVCHANKQSDLKQQLFVEIAQQNTADIHPLSHNDVHSLSNNIDSENLENLAHQTRQEPEKQTAELNGHGNYVIQNNEACHDRFPLPIPLMEQLALRLSTMKPCKSLVIPEGEGANESLSEFHVNDFIANARIRLAKSAQARETIAGVKAEVDRIALILADISAPIKGHSTTIPDDY